MFIVVLRGRINNLKPKSCFTAPFFTKNDGRRWRCGVTVDLFPRRMECAIGTELLKKWIGLGIFLTERVLGKAVVFEKQLDFHRFFRGKSRTRRMRSGESEHEGEIVKILWSRFA